MHNTESEGSMRFRNLRAQGHYEQNTASARAQRFLKSVDSVRQIAYLV